MKNILKYSAIVALGIGLFFGKYLGRWIVNIIDNPGTRINNGKLYVKQYLNNCDTVRLIMKNFTIKLDEFEVQGAFNLTQADNTAYLDKQTSVFFDDKSDKFYSIYYFFSSNSKNSQMYDAFISDVDQNGASIIAMVNKNELSDGTYGTKQKPVPIIYYEVPEKMNNFYSLVDDIGNPAYKTETEFKNYTNDYNTRNYLSYIKSKADFEKMFGEQPDK